MSKPSGRIRPQISLLGLMALAGGLLLIGMYFFLPMRRGDAELFAILIYLGVGSILGLWGLRAVLSDIWPRLGRLGRRDWNRHRARMTRPAMAYLAIMFTLFLGAMMGRHNMLLLVFGLMAGPFVINGSVTFNMLKGMRASRRLPPRAMAGDVFSVDLQLDNRKRWFSSWMMIVRDRLTNGTDDLQGEVLFTRVPPRSERSSAYQARLLSRGRYSFGPIQVVCRHPLGLMERSIVVDKQEELIVYPRLGRLTTLWRQQTSDSSELVDQPQSRKGAFDDEFHSLREYRGGDNPRAIHWRTSARRNALMVREFHQARDQDLLIVLDLWQPARPTSDDTARVELAISFAATLCVEQCRHRGESELVLALCGEGNSLWEGPGNTASIDVILERLALAEAGASVRLKDTVADALERSRPHSQRLLITTRSTTDEAIAAIPGVHAVGSRNGHNGHGSSLRLISADPEQLSAWFVQEAPG